MSIRVELEDVMYKMSQCESCFQLARSTFGGEVIMVGPMTQTAKKTGWGDSSHFGSVSVAFDNAKPRVINGIVHLNIPINRENLPASDVIHGVDVYFDSLAHDLKPLP